MSLSIWKRRESEPLAYGTELSRLRDEMDRMFDRFFNGAASAMTEIEAWSPPLDISETDSEVTVKVDLPGVAHKDVKISVSGHTLTVSGDRHEEQEKKIESYTVCERRWGSFRRSVLLPETVDAEKITAESDNGVVTVRVPKRPGAKSRQIEIKPAKVGATSGA